MTGAWPLVDYASFERVTGPKTERWLVETVGGLAVAIGINLGLAARRPSTGPETAALSAGSATTFGAIDVIYFATGRLRPVYLVDAAVQAAILWTWARRRWHETTRLPAGARGTRSA